MIVKGVRTKSKINEDEIRLWDEYAKTRTNEVKERIVRRYFYLVRYVAEKYLERLPKSVQLDDLISSGLYGLLVSIEKFDITKGFKFESYSVKRIHGSILDDLRNIDWLPRATRQKTNRLAHTYEALEKKLGRAPSDQEIAKELKISLKELAELYYDYNAATLYSFQNFNNPDDEEVGIVQFEDKKVKEPFAFVLNKDLKEWINNHISTKERHIILMYYTENMTFKEIAKVLNITESRVSQLHARILLKLKTLAKKEKLT
ncbi:MAG: FliA/WhiG family RNA polymerase sigma factor [Planctomycetes bacterium]|nr:FliA/WhiG family RNA polymerase sigma factor [Planctomycetota bacterium]